MISIIVPIYNAELYLRFCIDSILRQTYKNFELLLIDDGSIDDSLKICNEYKKLDDRIVVVSKNNEGVSSTRNLGIDLSNGDYITFIDSDDYVEPDLLLELIIGLEKNKADASVVGHNLVGINRGFTDSKFLNSYNKKLLKRELMIKYVIDTSKDRFLGYSVRILYSSNIIKKNKLYFDTNLKLFEDFIFILKYFDVCRYIYVCNKPLYMYRINENSTTRKYIEDFHCNSRYVNDYIYKKFVEKNSLYSTGYSLCEASVYAGYINNLIKKLSSLRILTQISDIYTMKRKYKYGKHLKISLFKKFFSLSINQIISYSLLFLNLEFLYIIIYKFYDKIKK